MADDPLAPQPLGRKGPLAQTFERADAATQPLERPPAPAPARAADPLAPQPLGQKGPLTQTFQRANAVQKPVERPATPQQLRALSLLNETRRPNDRAEKPREQTLPNSASGQSRPAKHEPVAGLQHGPKEPRDAAVVNRPLFAEKQKEVHFQSRDRNKAAERQDRAQGLLAEVARNKPPKSIAQEFGKNPYDRSR